MIKLKRITVILSFVFALVGTSVASDTIKNDSDSQTLQEQFESLIKKSTVYQSYRVVSIGGIQRFGKNLNDSLKMSIDKSKTLKLEINRKDKTIEELQVKNDSINNALVEMTASKESMEFFGSNVSKGRYNSLVWTIIVVLAILVGILFVLFKRSNVINNSTKNRLDEIQDEFENHRRTALEREQKLARKLHTELHKNR